MKPAAAPRWAVLTLLSAIALALGADAPRELNGFRVDDAKVPAELLVPGGPARDQIRAVDEPVFVPPREATWVRPDTPVIGVALGDEARAYPVHLLERHQVVNDRFGEQPIVVSFDPLSGSPVAFRGRLPGKDGRALAFGVSGLVYNANFLLYDRETRSLWSQLLGRAISGKLAGRELERLRVRQETLGHWLGRHPGSRVLAPPDAGRIDYRLSPFTSYWVEDEIPFPVRAKDARFHAKEVVLGLEAGGKARAYLGSIATATGGSVRDEFQGHTIRIRYFSEDAVFVWEAPEAVRVTDAYWFAWKAFHPDTEIWRPAEPATQARSSRTAR